LVITKLTRKGQFVMENIQNDHRVIEFVANGMVDGVVAFDRIMTMVYCNRSAELILDRLSLPGEVDDICRRMLDALGAHTFREKFPGEVILYKKIDGSPGNWTFRFHIYENGPLVFVFMHEESLSEKADLLKMRRHFRLTRRETDVIRRVINGLKNGEIAKEFNISEQTVKDHLSNAYQKIGVGNRVELLSFLFNSQLSDNFRRDG